MSGHISASPTDPPHEDFDLGDALAQLKREAGIPAVFPGDVIKGSARYGSSTFVIETTITGFSYELETKTLWVGVALRSAMGLEIGGILHRENGWKIILCNQECDLAHMYTHSLR